MPKRTETRIDAKDSGVTIGVDAGSFSAAISTSGILSLGIGIAEVNLNLKNLQESEINYAFGLYSIEGEQSGCTVILRYYIGGVLAQTETRTIPECDKDDDKDDNKDDNNDDNNNDNNDDNADTPNPKPITGWYGSGQYISESNEWEKSLVKWYDSSTGSLLCTGKSSNTKTVTISRTSLGGGIKWTITVTIKGSHRTIFSVSEYQQYNRTHDNDSTYSYFIYSDVAAWYADPNREPQPNIAKWGTLQDVQEKLNKKSKKETYHENRDEGWVGLTEHYLLYAREEGYSSNTIEYILDATIPNIVQKKQPPPYKEPPAMDCDCKKIEELLDEIHGVLGIKEMLDEGFIIPNRVIAPNAKGNTKLENYLQILEWQFRQSDHLGIHPFIATIKDSNEAIAGDQSLSIQFPNATAAVKYIAETVMEGKGDAAVRLSLLVRLSYASAQITTIIVQAARGIKALSSYFGMPLIERIESVKIPFDILLGTQTSQSKGGKGFGKETTKSGEQVKAELLIKIDQNSEDATEDMLPDFMKAADLPVKTQDFKPSTESDFWAFLKRVMRVD